MSNFPFLSFLGIKCYSCKFTSILICDLDCFYFLFPRNSHLGSYNRRNCCCPVFETNWASLGSTANLYILWRSEFFCCCAIFTLLLSTFCHHEKHRNFVRCENSWTHRISCWLVCSHNARNAEFTYCEDTLGKFY